MKLREHFIPLEDANAWNASLDGLPHSFAHTHAYNAAIAEDPTFLYVAEGEHFRVAVALMEREFAGVTDIVSPYGFSGFAWTGNTEGFVAHFKQAMAARGYVAGYIVQHPLVAALAEKGDVFYGKQCFLLDLTQPPGQLLAGVHSTHRNLIRQWERDKPRILSDKARLLPAFLALYPQSMERVNAKDTYRFGSETLSRLIAHPGAVLIGVERAEKIEAVSLYLMNDDYAEYYLHTSTPEGRDYARGLIWHAASWFAGQGVTTLNLGCGIREGDALEQFKQRFGGKAQRFTILKQVYNPTEYACLCSAHGANPADRGGFFPAYRAGVDKQAAIA